MSVIPLADIIQSDLDSFVETLNSKENSEIYMFEEIDVIMLLRNNQTSTAPSALFKKSMRTVLHAVQEQHWPVSITLAGHYNVLCNQWY